MSERSQDATDITGARFGDHRLPERFWEKVEPEPNSGCWLWTASVRPNGYGSYWIGTQPGSAHRTAYGALVEPLVDGKVLDHVCRVRHCVNPRHLRQVEQRDNTMAPGSLAPAKKNAESPTCGRGHPWTEETTYRRKRDRGGRTCRTCLRDWRKKPRAYRDRCRSTFNGAGLS